MKNYPRLSRCHTVFSVFLLCFLSSCTQKNTDSDALQPENVAAEVFIPDSLLQKPFTICALDNGLIVVNNMVCDTLIDVYNSAGQPVKSLLTKGHGPEEVIGVGTVSYNSDKNALFVQPLFAPELLVMYNPLSDSKLEPLMKFEREYGDSIMGSVNIVPLGDNFFIHSNVTPQGMIAVFDSDGNPLSVNAPYPDKNHIDSDLTDAANIALYGGPLRVSPSGKFALLNHDTSDIKVFMNLQDGKIDLKIFENAYPDHISVFKYENSVESAHTGQSVFHYLDASLGNQNAYLLHDGRTFDEQEESDYFKDTKRAASQDVEVYDSYGKLIRRLYLETPVERIAVSPDETSLFAITQSSTDGYTILRFPL